MSEFIFLPMLGVQRSLLDMPRGMERFRAYLAQMLDDAGEMVLPIHGFNPMSKAHVASALDALMAAKAEEQLQAVLRESFEALDFGPSPWRVGLVVADDLMGGWTHRPSLTLQRLTDRRSVVWRSFMPLIWWVSEAYDEVRFQFELRRQLYEVRELLAHPPPNDLGEILALRGRSRSFAGEDGRVWSPEGQRDARRRLEPHLRSTTTGALLAGLFGDRVGEAIGHPAIGVEEGDAEAVLGLDGIPVK